MERQLQGDSGGGEHWAGAVPGDAGPARPGQEEEQRAIKCEETGKGDGKQRHQEVGSLRPVSGLARAPRHSDTQQVRKAKEAGGWFSSVTEVFCRLGWGLRGSG